MLTVKNCVLLNSVQEFMKVDAWLRLTFFICLHNFLENENLFQKTGVSFFVERTNIESALFSYKAAMSD